MNALNDKGYDVVVLALNDLYYQYSRHYGHIGGCDGGDENLIPDFLTQTLEVASLCHTQNATHI